MGLIENPKFFGTTTVPPAQKFTFAIKSTTEKPTTTTPTTVRPTKNSKFRFPTTTPTMVYSTLYRWDNDEHGNLSKGIANSTLKVLGADSIILNWPIQDFI